jgi:DNA transposition AAA+ family ATPase
MTLFAAFSYVVEAANEHNLREREFLITRRSSHLIELLIVDEANRLKDAWIEQIRDIYDKDPLLSRVPNPSERKRASGNEATSWEECFN